MRRDDSSLGSAHDRYVSARNSRFQQSTHPGCDFLPVFSRVGREWPDFTDHSKAIVGKSLQNLPIFIRPKLLAYRASVRTFHYASMQIEKVLLRQVRLNRRLAENSAAGTRVLLRTGRERGATPANQKSQANCH